ncbi:MFS transporter [Rhodococcus sp. T7]|uniref:MFS transporter n=1 Tax=Rhodococcus sp. T7 TaxID=627444 RepID=UPI0022A8A64F|nr:MFS transporter [Rhodococcus sp. T7]
MRPYQYVIVFLCTFCSVIDGYDLIVMGYVLPNLPAGFTTADQKGYLISAGLIGMGVGAAILAPLADKIGRRPLIIMGLTVTTSFVAATALAPTAEAMMAVRFVTGMGVGAVMVSSIVLVQEFSPVSRRNFVIGVLGVGGPVGGMIAGFVGLSLTSTFSGAWQPLLWAGAGINVIGLVLVVFLLPESLSFLMSKRTPAAQRKIEKIIARVGITGVDPSAPAPSTGEAETGEGKQRLLGSTLRERSILLWIAYGGFLAAFYFVNTWTPQLISDASGDTQAGALVGTILSIGQIGGSVLFGFVGLKVLATRISWTALLVSVVSVVGFALLLGSTGALVVVVVLGIAIYVGAASFGAMAPGMYPPLARAKGYGMMLGMGRIGAIAAPIGAGYGLAVLAPTQLYLAASVPLLISAICCFRIWQITRDEFDRERASARPEATSVVAELES